MDFETVIRHQICAFIATLFDFSVLVICVETFNFSYIPSVAIGALCGGFSNFLHNHRWVFLGRTVSIQAKVYRYFTIMIYSLLLNTLLVYLLTEFLYTHYIVSKVISAVLISIGFNFQLHRLYVFK
jgi:putative flippase GtrA